MNEPIKRVFKISYTVNGNDASLVLRALNGDQAVQIVKGAHSDSAAIHIDRIEPLGSEIGLILDPVLIDKLDQACDLLDLSRSDFITNLLTAEMQAPE